MGRAMDKEIRKQLQMMLTREFYNRLSELRSLVSETKSPMWYSRQLRVQQSHYVVGHKQ